MCTFKIGRWRPFHAKWDLKIQKQMPGFISGLTNWGDFSFYCYYLVVSSYFQTLDHMNASQGCTSHTRGGREIRTGGCGGCDHSTLRPIEKSEWRGLEHYESTSKIQGTTSLGAGYLFGSVLNFCVCGKGTQEKRSMYCTKEKCWPQKSASSWMSATWHTGRRDCSQVLDRRRRRCMGWQHPAKRKSEAWIVAICVKRSQVAPARRKRRLIPQIFLEEGASGAMIK